MPGKRIDAETKEKVIKAHLDGATRKEISEKYGVSVRSITRIVANKPSPVKQGSSGTKKPENERQKRIEGLERRLELLEKRILDLDAKKR